MMMMMRGEGGAGAPSTAHIRMSGGHQRALRESESGSPFAVVSSVLSSVKTKNNNKIKAFKLNYYFIILLLL